MKNNVKEFYEYAKIYCSENINEYSDCIDINNRAEVFKNKNYIDPEDNFFVWLKLRDLSTKTDKIYCRKNEFGNHVRGALIIKAKFITGSWIPTNQKTEFSPLKVSRGEELRSQLLSIGLEYPWEWIRDAEIEALERARICRIEWSIQENKSKITIATQQMLELQKIIEGLNLEISIDQEKILCAAQVA